MKFYICNSAHFTHVHTHENTNHQIIVKIYIRNSTHFSHTHTHTHTHTFVLNCLEKKQRNETDQNILVLIIEHTPKTPTPAHKHTYAIKKFCYKEN